MHNQRQRKMDLIAAGHRAALLRLQVGFGRTGLGAVFAVMMSLAAVFTIPAQAQVAPNDVITANRFTITIDGYEIASFTELSGLVSEVEPSEYWEVAESGVIYHKLPGKRKPPTITLKGGLSANLQMWAWHEAVRLGSMAAARRSASLTMFSSDGKPVAKYWLEKAWPSKLELSGLKAGASQALFQAVTLTCEYIQRVAP